MNITPQQEMYAQVVQKCWEDADFKQRLVDSPVETLEKFTGKPLNIPEGKTLVVRDQTAESTVYINIPAKVEDKELSEKQLEATVGGSVYSYTPDTIFGPHINR